jgi:hypothetical protein
VGQLNKEKDARKNFACFRWRKARSGLGTDDIIYALARSMDLGSFYVYGK